MSRRSVVILFLAVWAICIAIIVLGNPSTVPDDGGEVYRSGFWTGSRVVFPAIVAAIVTLVVAGVATLVSRIRR